MKNGMRVIDIENHFNSDLMMIEWKNSMSREEWLAMSGGRIDDSCKDSLKAIQDIEEYRLQKMDEAGIDYAQLSLGVPGAEYFPVEIGKRIATDANNRIAEAIKKHPDRIGGYIVLAPDDPEWCIKEIDRTSKLGLFGWLTPSNYNGKYLDDPKYFPILEKLASIGMPIYLHPNYWAISDYTEFGYCINGPSLGFGANALLAYMRLIHRGVFDKLPNLKIILGHNGEGLPFFKDRIDTAWRQGGGQPLTSIGVKIKHEPSYYLANNTYITTSGNNLPEALRCTIDVLGTGKCMMSTDFPCENANVAVSFVADSNNLTTIEKESLLHNTAESLGFGVPRR